MKLATIRLNVNEAKSPRWRRIQGDEKNLPRLRKERGNALEKKLGERSE